MTADSKQRAAIAEVKHKATARDRNISKPLPEVEEAADGRGTVLNCFYPKSLPLPSPHAASLEASWWKVASNPIPDPLVSYSSNLQILLAVPSAGGW